MLIQQRGGHEIYAKRKIHARKKGGFKVGLTTCNYLVV
jgi:hypothetical protein